MLPWERREQLRDQAVSYRYYDQPELIKSLVKTRSFVRMGLATVLEDDQRKAVMGWLLREDRRPISTKDLTGAEVMALSDWVKPGYFEGEFLVSEEFRNEIKWIVMEVRDAKRNSTSKERTAFDFGFE